MTANPSKKRVDTEPEAMRPDLTGRNATHTRAADAAKSWIGALRVESPVSFGEITMVPLRAPAAVDPGWLLLDEALARGSTEVSEISRAGAVPVLHVVNRGTRDVLLLDGEEVIGAKQNRILNTTVLVRAASAVEIPVSCVEQGRWAYRSHRFSTSGNFLYARVRRKKVAQVSASLRQGFGHASNQMGIWSDLRRRSAELGVESPVMADAFAANEPNVRAYQLALRPGSDQVGALVYGGEAWWGMDTLASAELFAKAWPRILSGYVMDALWSHPAGEPKERGTERLRAVLDASVEVFAGIGAGDDCRFRGSEVVGAALIVDDVVGHSMAFPC